MLQTKRLKLRHYWANIACEVIDYCLKHCDELGHVSFTFQDFAKICGYSSEYLEDDFIDLMDYINGLKFKAPNGQDYDLLISMKDQDETFILIFNKALLNTKNN